MEHRYAERKPVAVNVLVSCPRVGLLRGTTIDVSAGGMFVATDCIAMPLNAPVTVSFQPNDDRPLVCFQAKGMVVHQKDHGFGLMFDELEPTCRRALRELLTATCESEASQLLQGPKQAAIA